MRAALPLLIAFLWAVPGGAIAADADYHHVHIVVTNGDVAAQWYINLLGCQALPSRTDVAQCGDVQLLFIARPARGGNEGTAVDHISFSFPDLDAKIKQLLDVGVAGSGVRVMDRESPIKQLPGLFKVAYVKDPWGTKIELVEDPAQSGLHHIHLFSADPNATLAWYQSNFGGKPGKLKGQLNGLQFGKTWLVATPSSGALQPMTGRVIDHLGFAVSDYSAASGELQKKGLQVRADETGKAGIVTGPDGALVEIVQK